jgi:hypothetical protein
MPRFVCVQMVQASHQNVLRNACSSIDSSEQKYMPLIAPVATCIVIFLCEG